MSNERLYDIIAHSFAGSFMVWKQPHYHTETDLVAATYDTPCDIISYGGLIHNRPPPCCAMDGPAWTAGGNSQRMIECIDIVLDSD